MNAIIAGCGTISHIHIQSLIASNVKIVGLCDILKERAEQINKKFNLSAPIFTNYQQMLDSVVADCVHICTPHYLHAKMIVSALEKNVNVFTEKPMCISTEEVLQIKKAKLLSKAGVGVCMQNRFLESSMFAKQIIDRNKTKSGFLSVIWSRDSQYFLSAPWRGQKEFSGGGALINQAIHTLDLLQWLLGTPQTINVNINNYMHKQFSSIEDTASGCLKINNAEIQFYTTLNGEYNHAVEICLEGTKKIKLSENKLFINEEEILFKQSLPLDSKSYWGQGHLSIIKEFYKCLENNCKFCVDEVEGAKSVQLILEIYKAAKIE